MNASRMVAITALALSLAFVFADQARDDGFRRGHRGWVSAHTLAIATLPGAIHSDLAVAGDFLETDPVAPHIPMTGGRFLPFPSAGIGCEPDETAIAPYIVRETVQ